MHDNALEHTLHVIRRQVDDEFPDLTLNFVVYDGKGDRSSLTNNLHLPDTPQAEAIHEHLMQAPASHSDLICIGRNSKSSFPYFRKKEKFLALCLVNLEKLNIERALIFPDQPERYDRIVGHALAWKAINLYRKYKKEENRHYHIKDDLIIPKRTKTQGLRENLLSECYASMLMEQHGEAGTILQLMKRRSELCITQNLHYKPERHPYPIAYDATRIVFAELKNTDPEKTGSLIRHTMDITEEIDATCEDITLLQWREFCFCAQEMAWHNRNKHEILSAATYSSEDAYMRTTAYIIAEALNTDVTPLNKPQFHNPFADQEKYERQHFKNAIALFEELLTTAIEETRPEIFYERALEQNKALYKGQIIGWCVPALIRTANAYSKADTRTELLQDIFERALIDTKWKDICKLSRFIMLKNRKDAPVNNVIILNEFVSNHEELVTFRDAFTPH